MIAAFAFGQVINAAAYARSAHAGLPAGGKEGWYWYALVPIIVPAFLAPAVKRWRVIALWLVVCDIVIHEIVLFHDFDGSRSPAQRETRQEGTPGHKEGIVSGLTLLSSL